MTSQNVLQPINCNVRDPDGSPLSKRARRDFTYTTKPESTQRWSLSSGTNELDILAEMGLGMLESDEISDYRSEDDRASSSQTSHTNNYDHNDTNPELINLPGLYLPISNETSAKSLNSAIKERTCDRKTLLRHSESWEDFCIYRRSSMMNQDSKDWFNCLSDEIILMILRWLPKIALTRCALVCKRWYSLASDETLWTRLDCSTKVLGPGALGQILSRGVIILKLAQTDVADPPILPNVKAHSDDFIAKLMYLDLSMSIISTDGLTTLLEKCRRLRKISVESCIVNDTAIAQLSQNDKLEVLNLTMVAGLTKNSLSLILSSCQELKELNLAWTGLTVDILDLLCVALPRSLNRLNLSGCRKTLNLNHIKSVVTSCPYLRELDLSDGTALTNDAIKYLTSLNELNFLALSRCYGINCCALKKLTYMKALQFLDIHGGHIEQREIDELQTVLGNKVQLNKFMFSSIARPTVGMKRSSIWGLRVDVLKDNEIENYSSNIRTEFSNFFDCIYTIRDGRY